MTKRTFGGVLELSQQDIDWSDPSALQLRLQEKNPTPLDLGSWPGRAMEHPTDRSLSPAGGLPTGTEGGGGIELHCMTSVGSAERMFRPIFSPSATTRVVLRGERAI